MRGAGGPVLVKLRSLLPTVPSRKGPSHSWEAPGIPGGRRSEDSSSSTTLLNPSAAGEKSMVIFWREDSAPLPQHSPTISSLPRSLEEEEEEDDLGRAQCPDYRSSAGHIVPPARRHLCPGPLLLPCSCAKLHVPWALLNQSPVR